MDPVMVHARISAFGVAAVLGVMPAVALAVTSGVYDGASRPGNRHMDIAIQVTDGGRRANWRIDVYGPCTENERLGRTVGTDAGSTPPDPRLRITSGRFTLTRRATNPNTGLQYSYVLTGRSARGGFAGTFHYTEHQGAYRCDSTVLRWSAHRTKATFP